MWAFSFIQAVIVTLIYLTATATIPRVAVAEWDSKTWYVTRGVIVVILRRGNIYIIGIYFVNRIMSDAVICTDIDGWIIIWNKHDSKASINRVILNIFT